MNYLKNIYIKKHSLFILLFLSFAGVSLGQIAKKTKVFILAGQSNMDGRGDASKLSKAEMKLLSNASQKIYFVYKGTVGEGNAIEYKGALDFTNPWSFVKKKFRIEKCFGPELFFGIELVKKHPKHDYLFIKRSQGGTSLYGAWNPNWSFEKASFFNEQDKPKLYQDFINLVDAELAKLNPDSYEIVGMLWVQDQVSRKILPRYKVPGEEHPADLMTKHLVAKTIFEHLPSGVHDFMKIWLPSETSMSVNRSCGFGTTTYATVRVVLRKERSRSCLLYTSPSPRD